MDPRLAAERLAHRRPQAGQECRLWQELLAAAKPQRIEWHWVKGHSGHPENDASTPACAEADARR